ncbi:TPA: hypothetical protein DEB04_01650, partial [Candidatus Giovannonibacteria bacterium]|nr:hypothetical protein [Candidatus Giovannonibacteria bacterium]
MESLKLPVAPGITDAALLESETEESKSLKAVTLITDFDEVTGLEPVIVAKIEFGSAEREKSGGRIKGATVNVWVAQLFDSFDSVITEEL